MKRGLLILMIAMFSIPNWLGAQEASSGLRFANPPEEVMSVYTRLSNPDGKDLYRSLSGSMRQDLWSLHLSRALVELTDLTTEQKAVIWQGLGLLSRGVLEVDRDHPDWELRAGESLQYLEDQSREILPREIRTAVFGHLGAGVTLTGEVTKGCSSLPTDNDKRLASCSCSTESDFCDWVTNPDPVCRRPSPQNPCRVRDNGCGFLWQHPCDGRCSA